MNSELLRRINNIIAIGTVTQSKSTQGLSLARIKILNRVTDFLPVIQSANSFKTYATPIRVGEQVVVLHPFGEGDSGVILGSIFNSGKKEPQGYSDAKEMTVYEDGTVVSYDTKLKVMEVNAVGTISITCQDASVTADNTTIISTTTHNGNVSIDGNLEVSGTISDSKGTLTGHVHTGVTPGPAMTGERP